MRNRFLSLGVVTAALALVGAPAAQAHHLDQDTSTLTCALVSNVPVVHASARYVDFSPWDQPVFWSESIDGTTVGGGSLSWTGPDYSHEVSFATTAGDHDVVYQASWNSGENGGYLSRRGLFCPTPVPPPPPPTPTPTPPPPTVVYYDCSGHQLPAGSPPATCPPPAQPKPPCGCAPPPRRPHCPTIHLIIPTARHGVHDFGGRCSKGKIVDTTLYVAATGPRGGDMTHGRRVVCGTAKLHSKGAVIHGVWLYDRSIFCHRLAWGSYRLTFVFRVRIHGRVFRCVKRARFFDHDPGGYPDTMAHAARSSWGRHA